MFGLGLGEVLVLIIVGIIVVGPRKLPTLMRSAGQWISKLRRMSSELRAQSGIDDLIRQEGLEREIQEIRSLSRVNIVDTLMAPGIAAAAVQPTAPAPQPVARPVPVLPPEPLREREYPLIGCDSYGALADDVEPPPPAPEEAPAPEPSAPPAPPAAPAVPAVPAAKESAAS